MPSDTRESFPSVDQLPAIEGLPEALVFRDGSRVATPQQWARRRGEIKGLFEHYMYGRMPPAPGNVTARELSRASIFNGSATHRMVMLSFGPQRKLTIRLSLVEPNRPAASGPLPVMLYLMRGDELPEGGLWPDCDLIAGRGYIGACFGNADCDPDSADRSDGYHPYYPDYDWGSLACWAWGMHRCVDWLVTQPQVDARRIAVCGHSRRGKAALLAGAFDERIALAAPSGSGCGGVALSRSAEMTPGAQTLREITRQFSYWFSPRLGEFADHVDRLPVDQHMLISLMAPRPVIAAGGQADLWANPPAERAALLAAESVYKLLGVGGTGENLAAHFREGGHDIIREDWSAILDFCDFAMHTKTI